jgi:hypothetical protein
MGPAFLFLLASFSVGVDLPCDKAIEVEAGSIVPCSNAVLLPYPMAEELLLCRDIELPRCETRLDREAFMRSTKLSTCLQETESCEQALTKTDELLEKAIEDRSQPAWYENVWMNIAVGVAIGSALTASVM